MEIPLNCRYGLSAPMVERSRQDSSRDLLEELEDGWGAPLPPPQGAPLPALKPKADVAQPPDAASAADAAAATDEVTELAQSNPDLASLDEGWLDELFPGEEGDEDDDEEEDEDEPELPDERLDPEAFALAKKAREERAAGKKEKKRAKAEAKRERQKARAAAMRQKQKAKKARPASPPRREPEPAKKRKREQPQVAAEPSAIDRDADNDAAETSAALEPTKPRSKSTAPRPARSTLGSVKLLAIVLVVLVAVAAAVAAIAK